jgi:hypothetical protein
VLPHLVTPAAPEAAVADVLFDLPITATAALETAIRAQNKQLLPAGHFSVEEDRINHAKVIAEGAVDYSLMHTTGSIFEVFAQAAGSGKLRAAAAATDLLQLAPRLYCLLVTSCKCLNAIVLQAADRIYISGEYGRQYLWKSISDTSVFLAALLASLSFLALPGDHESTAQQLHNSSSSSKLATTGSRNQGGAAQVTNSSSSSSLAAQLGSGPGPWLHLAGRGLLLLAQLLKQLPHQGCPFSAPQSGARALTVSVITIVETWGSIAERLQGQLQDLTLLGVADEDAAKVRWVCGMRAKKWLELHNQHTRHVKLLLS